MTERRTSGLGARLCCRRPPCVVEPQPTETQSPPPGTLGISSDGGSQTGCPVCSSLLPATLRSAINVVNVIIRAVGPFADQYCVTADSSLSTMLFNVRPKDRGEMQQDPPSMYNGGGKVAQACDPVGHCRACDMPPYPREVLGHLEAYLFVVRAWETVECLVALEGAKSVVHSTERPRTVQWR